SLAQNSSALVVKNFALQISATGMSPLLTLQQIGSLLFSELKFMSFPHTRMILDVSAEQE
ncbi:MAG: hypothetical protein MK321_12775, partial [Pseudomonadales bacterium]|nr:hypothetical protein [Pseudomonadales bacterium]